MIILVFYLSTDMTMTINGYVATQLALQTGTGLVTENGYSIYILHILTDYPIICSINMV